MEIRYRCYPERTVKTRPAYTLKTSLYYYGKKIHEAKVQYHSGRKREMATQRADTVPSLPQTVKLEEAVYKLLCCDKVVGVLSKKGMIHERIYSNSLADTWLTLRKGIESKYWPQAEAAKYNNQLLVRMVICFGEFDLSRFRRQEKSDEDHKAAINEAVDKLRDKILRLPGYGGHDRLHELIIRKSRGEPVDPDKTPRCDQSAENTKTVLDYANALWRVIATYLDIYDKAEIRKIQAIYFSKFRAPIKPASKTLKANLVQRRLSNREYRQLYHWLAVEPMQKGKRISDANAAALMCALMGLRADEVCALDATDIVGIPGYKGHYCIRVTKRLVKNKGAYVISEDLEDKRVRYVPIPDVINRFLPTGSRGPLFWAKGHKQRLTPDTIKGVLGVHFPGKRKTVKTHSHTRGREVDLSFEPSDNHMAMSCAALWRDNGLSDGEIRYLLGRAPNDTVSKYYIDYSNPHMLYAMLVHMDHAANSIIMDTDCTPVQGNFGLLSDRYQHKAIAGVPGHTIAVHLQMTEPAEIHVESEHGITVNCWPDD